VVWESFPAGELQGSRGSAVLRRNRTSYAELILHKKLALTFAVAAYVVPADLLTYYFLLEPIRVALKDLVGSDAPVDTLCGVACGGMIGLAYLVAITSMVLVVANFPGNTRAIVAAIGGFAFAIIASLVVLIAHLLDELSGPWI
jgi:hypothetical protein